MPWADSCAPARAIPPSNTVPFWRLSPGQMSPKERSHHVRHCHVIQRVLLPLVCPGLRSLHRSVLSQRPRRSCRVHPSLPRLHRRLYPLRPARRSQQPPRRRGQEALQACMRSLRQRVQQDRLLPVCHGLRALRERLLVGFSSCRRACFERRSSRVQFVGPGHLGGPVGRARFW